jgi:nucleoside-diphosphate-sugar epimerase
MKNAIVTGASGFLGLALTKELAQNGVRVRALCRENSNRISRLNGIPNIEILEANLNRLDNITTTGNIDTFYHLAWDGEGGRNGFDGQYKNIEMSLNCLRLASKLGCKRFICTGSQAEFGNTDGLITEDTPLKPTTAYGACKTAVYYLTADLAKRLNIEHTWARIFSVYGPNDAQSTLISTLIKNLRETGEGNLDTNGEHIWNYLFENDAARALYLLGATRNSNTTYNVASRENKPLKSFTEDLRKVFGDRAAISYGKEKSTINLNVSITKLIDAIGEYETSKFAENIRGMVSKGNV